MDCYKNVGLKGVFTKDEMPPDPTVYKLIYDSNEAPYNVEIDGFTNEISNVTGLPNPKTVELNAQQLSAAVTPLQPDLPPTITTSSAGA